MVHFGYATVYIACEQNGIFFINLSSGLATKFSQVATVTGIGASTLSFVALKHGKFGKLCKQQSRAISCWLNENEYELQRFDSECIHYTEIFFFSISLPCCERDKADNFLFEPSKFFQIPI